MSTDPRAERLLAEAPKDGPDRRSPFARDRARVLHSAALRRLAGKTQVVGPDEDAEITGVPRTRLTHSLEVAQIGRGIAEELGAGTEIADIVDTAGLAHDIGHPPFGHNGERALHALAGDCGGFEGNAQTLRILTRLEPKTLDDERCRGLNLTRASLDACIKYPWPRREDQRKFGVYADDVDVFVWVRDGAPGGRGSGEHADGGARLGRGRDPAPCLEARIMDWADDVAYSVHDLEDAILAGRLALGRLARPTERAEIAGLAAEAFSSASPAALEAAVEAVVAMVPPAIRGPYDGSLEAAVGLKRLTSGLVGRFVTSAVVASTLPDLAVDAGTRAEVAVLKAAALRWVMRDPHRLALQARERALVTELAERLLDGAPRALDPAFVPAWEAAGGHGDRLRVVVDQVAVLTDAQARTRCERLRSGDGVRWTGSVVGDGR